MVVWPPRRDYLFKLTDRSEVFAPNRFLSLPPVLLRVSVGGNRVQTASAPTPQADEKSPAKSKRKYVCVHRIKLPTFNQCDI